jgi:outer membrane murein-binding lipoprotein Lpp
MWTSLRGRIICGAVVATAGPTLAGCASLMPSPSATAPVQICDRASASVTMASREVATYFAKVRLAEQIGEVRSELSAAGVLLARAERVVRCEPYRLFGPDTGLYKCTATAEVCSR